jgi:hypothetical protein
MASDFLTLQQPIGEGGIESVNFFNGRLLTAGDMAREQAAQRQADSRLGEALGDGIAFGFEIAVRAPDGEDPVASLDIQPGLAINRAGACLRLSQPERVHLSRIDSTSFAASGCSFDDCAPLVGGTYVAGEGLYLLTVAPAEISAGRAPSNGLGGTNPYCDVDRKVEAVQFRLLEITPDLYSGLSPVSADFRNALAYLCFGKGVLVDYATALLAGGARGDGLLEQMASRGLSTSDVPLALVGFQGAAELTLIDLWAIRRPLSLGDPAGAFHSLAAPRRLAVGRAMFEQFQAHLQDLRDSGGVPGTFTARSHFPYLPPVGILPRMSAAEATAFFGDMKVRGPVHINSATVELLIRESMAFPAIRSAGSEVVWLYAVAENLIEGTRALADPLRPDPYLVFASGNVAYRADARFDLHRWNYANYALGGG